MASDKILQRQHWLAAAGWSVGRTEPRAGTLRTAALWVKGDLPETKGHCHTKQGNARAFTKTAEGREAHS